MKSKPVETTIQPLFTIKEVSRQLRRSPASMVRDIRERKLDIIRVGRSVRIPQSSVERLLARGLVAAK
ncbi:MAG: helix-turn-helix domain-containing protein [Nitrospirota bacterium]|nr:helix-turn-helix domain-containing protein [Nitrospirota bacterium]